MRLICIGDTNKNIDGRPCATLSSAILEGKIVLRMSGREGVLNILREFPSDVAVIQQTQPEPSLVKIIRNHNFNIPILVIARTLTAKTVAGALLAGADDCVSITVEPIELLARLRTIVRRHEGDRVNSQLLAIGRLKIKEETTEVLLDDEPLMLTHAEYEIMILMVKRRGSLLNKTVILNALYSGENMPASKTIDVMICRIRQKFRKRGISEPFRTSWGMGYRLNDEAFQPLGARALDELENIHHVSKESSLPLAGGLGIVSNTE